MCFSNRSKERLFRQTRPGNQPFEMTICCGGGVITDFFLFFYLLSVYVCLSLLITANIYYFAYVFCCFNYLCLVVLRVKQVVF